MKTLVIYSSRHRMNTEKVAQAIAAELGADLRRLADVKPSDLDAARDFARKLPAQ